MPIKPDMAESYFELLTEHDGLPAKPFDPVEELKRLRRMLMLRLQDSVPPAESVADVIPISIKVVPVEENPDVSVPLLPETIGSPSTESVSLESIIDKASDIKKTLTLWQRSRFRAQPERSAMFRGNAYRVKRKPESAPRQSAVVTSLTAPREETLATVNAGLVALGIIGVVFGVLTFFQGLESNLSAGLLVCATGVTITVIGLGGRLLAARSGLSGA